VSRAATLSDIEPRFMCSACGKRGADVPPDFNWKKMPVKAIGFRQSSSDCSQSTAMRVAHERGAGAPPSGWSKTDDTVFCKTNPIFLREINGQLGRFRRGSP
jgi:hypothetical protein